MCAQKVFYTYFILPIFLEINNYNLNHLFLTSALPYNVCSPCSLKQLSDFGTNYLEDDTDPKDILIHYT